MTYFCKIHEFLEDVGAIFEVFNVKWVIFECHTFPYNLEPQYRNFKNEVLGSFTASVPCFELLAYKPQVGQCLYDPKLLETNYELATESHL